MPIEIIFVTGNRNKVREVQAILGDAVNLKHVDLELPEYQGDRNFIVTEKAKYAAEKIDGNILVEDVSLAFNALGGLPGPYIKWFVQQAGVPSLPRMLQGFDTKEAAAMCTYCIIMKGKNPLIVEGKVMGTIVEPRGQNGFGWDAVFLPNGFETTYAEMTTEVKNSMSERRIALTELLHLLKAQ